MDKYRYLFENIELLIISSFGTKILSFILIPIYSSILSTADYGTYDVYSTTMIGASANTFLNLILVYLWGLLVR